MGELGVVVGIKRWAKKEPDGLGLPIGLGGRGGRSVAHLSLVAKGIVVCTIGDDQMVEQSDAEYISRFAQSTCQRPIFGRWCTGPGRVIVGDDDGMCVVEDGLLEYLAGVHEASGEGPSRDLADHDGIVARVQVERHEAFLAFVA